MPKISDYPKLRFMILGDYLEVLDESGGYGFKVVGYVHMNEMNESDMLEFAEEFVMQARNKIRARNHPEEEEARRKGRAEIHQQS